MVNQLKSSSQKETHKMTAKKQLEIAALFFFWAFVAAGIVLIGLAWGLIEIPKS